MLELREICPKDAEEAYRLIAGIPENENGFMNSDAGVSFEEFRDKSIPRMQARARGEELSEGHVPDTVYILWEDGKAVGMFKFRHYLNDALRKGSGHIGYGIGQAYRGRGLAAKGLALLIERVRDVIPEDEIYLSCRKYNTASLKTMLKNGAYIHHEDEEEYYTRIPLK